MRTRCSGDGIGSFHLLNMSPLISQVESEIPIVSGDHSFKLNLGDGSFLRLKIFEKSFGAMSMCGLDDYGSGVRNLYVLVCGQMSMVRGKGPLANERRDYPDVILSFKSPHPNAFCTNKFR